MSVAVVFNESCCEAINQLVQTIKPSRESVERRYGVQEYVRKIIGRCFAPEQVRTIRPTALMSFPRFSCLSELVHGCIPQMSVAGTITAFHCCLRLQGVPPRCPAAVHLGGLVAG